MRTIFQSLQVFCLLIQYAHTQAIITPTVVITTHVSACTQSSTGTLFNTTSAASGLSSSQTLIPSGFVLSSSAGSGSVTLGSSSPSSTPSSISPSSTSLPASPLSGSSTSSTTTTSAVPVCGQRYSASNGQAYQITCGQTYGGDMLAAPPQQSATSFEACIESCAAISQCVASVFLPGNCTLLSAITSIVNTQGAVAAILADYVPVLADLATPSTSTPATVPGPSLTTATQGYSSAIGDHLSQKISGNAPVPTSDDTVVYVTPSMATSTSSNSVAAFSSQIAGYISQHLSDNAPAPTGPDSVVYATSATSSVFLSTMTSGSATVSVPSLASSSSSVTSSIMSNPAAPSNTSASTFSSSSPAAVSLSSIVGSSISSISPAASSSTSSPAGSSSSPSSFVSSSSSSSASSVTSTSSDTATPSQMSSFSFTLSLSSSGTQPSPVSSSIISSLSSTSTAASAISTPVRNTGKRGLPYNQANLTKPFALSGQDSQVSWAYDWYNAPCATPGVNDCNFNPALEFVPLLYSDDPNLLSAWPTAAQIAIDSGSTALMSFNEPDFCGSDAGSACMSVSTAVYYYQQYMQLFAGKALLGAPAVTNSGGTANNPAGLQYLQYFLGNCTGCTIDFIEIHWYSNKYAGASYFESHVNAARAVAGGRPIWITEIGLDNEFSYTDSELQAFLQQILPWLDQQPDVARYAYFMDAPGILIDSAGDTLSGSGIVYNNFTNSTPQANAYTS